MELVRAKITLDILLPVEDQDTLSNMELSDILHECRDGAWSLLRGDEQFTLLNGETECQAACDEHGTDMEFFFMSDEGDEEE